MIRTGPAALLRGEAAAGLILSVALYRWYGEGWLLFATLLLAPDVAALGYLAGNRIGTTAYNLAHTLSIPILLAMVGLMGDSTRVVAIALVWSAHITFDRLIGYGLKELGTFRGHAPQPDLKPITRRPK